MHFRPKPFFVSDSFGEPYLVVNRYPPHGRATLLRLLKEVLTRHAPSKLLLARPLTRAERALLAEAAGDRDADAAGRIVGAEQARLRRRHQT